MHFLIPSLVGGLILRYTNYEGYAWIIGAVAFVVSFVGLTQITHIAPEVALLLCVASSVVGLVWPELWHSTLANVRMPRASRIVFGVLGVIILANIIPGLVGMAVSAVLLYLVWWYFVR